MKILSPALFLLSLLALPGAASASECKYVDGYNMGAKGTCKVCQETDKNGLIVWNIYATNRNGEDNGIVIYRSERLDKGSTVNTSWGNIESELYGRISSAVGTAGTSSLCRNGDVAYWSEKLQKDGKLPMALPASPKRDQRREDPREEE